MAGHRSQAEMWERGIFWAQKGRDGGKRANSAPGGEELQRGGRRCILKNRAEKGEGGGQGVRDISCEGEGKTGHASAQETTHEEIVHTLRQGAEGEVGGGG